ncbi:hypothetical protein [Streptomyces luteolus]|uniref:Uncharacterized protein n=1 Tax=Streptomyces luteolus TaxID=3043615 RepID=A0ABT6SUB7_9ACTN|nr:hypothetical protein [Streptomyces sp. B-S-A12]MDI3419205.1 hypothetical protein [Streptomyces sp. B-S-A12]
MTWRTCHSACHSSSRLSRAAATSSPSRAVPPSSRKAAASVPPMPGTAITI